MVMGNPEAINKRGVGVRQRLVSDKMRAGAGEQEEYVVLSNPYLNISLGIGIHVLG